jgi:hypothetical protein
MPGLPSLVTANDSSFRVCQRYYCGDNSFFSFFFKFFSKILLIPAIILIKRRFQMETTQGSAAEAPKQDETPAIVEQAFGKTETTPAPGEPPEKAAEGSPDSPKEAETPPNAAPPAPAPKRENRRIQSLTSEIEILRAKVAQYEADKDPKNDIDKRFAELQLEQTQRQMQEENYKILADAFPNEAERQDFIDLAEHYAQPLMQYASKAAELIAHSDISFKLEKAFYDICASDAAAFKDFLNMSFPAQRKVLQGLEAYLKNPAPPAAPQTPAAPTPPANLPKSIDPSDSEASAGGKPDIFNSTLKRIADERNGR